MRQLAIYRNHALLIRVITLLIAFVIAFASNMYLPSLPSLGNHFAASEEDMELTITFFLLGFGVSQLFYGPLSDRFGRKKVLCIGFLIGFIGALGCFMATSVTEFIFSRIILGCGMGAGSALARSMYRDTFSGIVLAKVVSQNGAIASIAPVLAPMLGGYIDKWYGYQINLLVIVIMTVMILIPLWLLLTETNKEPNLQALQPKMLVKNYFAVLSNRIFLGNVLCAGFCMSGLNAFITISPFLFMDTLKLSIVEYGWITGIVVSGMILGRILNTALLGWFRPQQNMKIGLTLMFLSGISLLIPGLMHVINVAVIIIPVYIFILGSAIVMTLAYAQSLEPFSKIAGSAGALYGSIMVLTSFFTSGTVAIIKSNNQNLLAVTYLLLSAGILLALQLLKLPSPILSLENDMEAEKL